MVYNISSGLLTSYISIQSNQKMTPEEMFKKLSLQMGGDGEKITKKQLDSYISKAEANPENTRKMKYTALKEIQNNWDEISHKKDHITLGDLGEYEALLALAAMDNFEKVEVSNNPSSTNGKLRDYLEEAIEKNEKGINKNDLTENLKELLADSSEGVDNSDEIATITNIIADFETFSGGAEHITAASLSSTTGHEA